MTTAPALSLRHLGSSYGPAGRRTPALVDIDLDVEAGHFVSVVGPSGSGKSTLLRIVAGLRPATDGQLSVLGTTPQAAGAAKRIGFAPQSPALLPWASALDNVALPLRVNRGRGRARRPRPATGRDPLELLGLVGLGDVADRRPGTLSGGMAQRVAIARALVTDPELLVMDEPFSALDELTREVLRDVLLSLWDPGRTTVLFVTHSVAEAVYLSDRIVVLSAGPGRVVADIADDLPRPRQAQMAHSAQWAGIEDGVRAALARGWGRGRP